MNKLEDNYKKYYLIKSDINEHFPAIKEYATKCSHITEMGVREGISTWAFLMGRPKRLISYDIREDTFINRKDIEESAKDNDILFSFIKADSLLINIEPTDLLFIDTYHAYGQLIRELNRHSDKVSKYILLHDTVSYASRDMELKYKVSVYEECNKHGLMPAVNDFLKNNKDWVIKHHYVNNNGLLVLTRTV